MPPPLSCRRDYEGQALDGNDSSSRSIAAPNVSGLLAAFLSVRKEFAGETDRVNLVKMLVGGDQQKGDQKFNRARNPTRAMSRAFGLVKTR